MEISLAHGPGVGVGVTRDFLRVFNAAFILQGQLKPHRYMYLQYCRTLSRLERNGYKVLGHEMCQTKN
ncbi:hypothetical protein CCR75_003118 [Bremia lactucae]|uniref:Uncharacterized protein n=1 Tax=Bremia lactucae TaxID=4779 RepID=A0A976ID42_BRELC|nr:hypothetical protein CCR75_003118 [Bremia lactucae]